MKNFHSGGGDPVQRLIATEEWRKRKERRELIKVVSTEGGVVIQIKLPLPELLDLAEKLENLDTLKERLHAVADAL